MAGMPLAMPAREPHLESPRAPASELPRPHSDDPRDVPLDRGPTMERDDSFGRTTEDTADSRGKNASATVGSSAPRRLAVGLDFSDGSRAALDAALREAHPDTTLHLVHVHEPPAPLAERQCPAAAARVERGTAEAARQRLDEIREGLAKRSVTVHAHLMSGDPASCLAALADDVDAERIVIGARGSSQLPHVRLGSVAERTIRHASCTVTAVRT